jgi:hypothetical protein
MQRLRYTKKNPICPVVNSIQAPTYKLAKFLAKKVGELIIELRNIYVANNSKQVACDLTRNKIYENHTLTNFDIRNFHVNLPIQEILIIVKTLLSLNITEHNTNRQCTMLLREIINQNYFQFDKNYYKGNTGITMGSPIAGIAAKIFLQYLKTYH